MFAEFNWYEWMSNSPVFLVLILCSVVTLTVAVERAIYFFGRRGDCDTCHIGDDKFPVLLNQSNGGDTSAWSTGAQTLFKGLNQARNLVLEPFMRPTVLMMMFAGVALVGLPRIRERRHGRKDNR